MTPLLLAFITGLTTGGLSCLAVQGGLLVSVVAKQLPRSPAIPSLQATLLQPDPKLPAFSGKGIGAILTFLLAKLGAYTVLGFLLGALGMVLQLTPLMRGTVQILIGAFMVVTALRMLNIHPLLRYFTLEPPSFINRWLRRTAKGGEAFAPALLGTLTVLIPCGITQTMMAFAIGTGDPWQGAGVMFAFTLGTIPHFFSLAYLVTHIGKGWESYVTRGVAMMVLVLGIVAVDGGLNLLGSPYSFNRLFPSSVADSPLDTKITLDPTATALPTPDAIPSSAHILPSALAPYLSPGVPAVQVPSLDTTADTETPPQSLTIAVTDYGYEPNLLTALAGQSLELKLVTENSYSCGRVFVIPTFNYETVLPETGVITVNLPPQPAGTKIYFTCGMGMYSGEIQYAPSSS